MVQAGMRERCVWLLASQPSSVHVRTVYTWIKVALGIGLCALVSYCLAFTQANHCSEFRMPKHFIANDQLPKQPLTNQAYTVMGADHFVGRSQKNFFGPSGVGSGPFPWIRHWTIELFRAHWCFFSGYLWYQCQIPSRKTVRKCSSPTQHWLRLQLEMANVFRVNFVQNRD